ncbi:MAG: hypothetical protein HY843_02225 [Bdellovibrio sp.]|nr:hypothetical protein [Bdellovibrio sp.]
MTTIKPLWIKYSLFNTLELVLTRAGDTFISLILLWFLPIELFSKFSIAQAFIAPLLLFYIAPETILYKVYNTWIQDTQESFQSKILALRSFSWLKGLITLFLAIVLSFVVPLNEHKLHTFIIFIWAFALHTSAHLYSTDREFLRLALKFGELNFITCYQKLVFIMGTLLCVLVFNKNIISFAIMGVFAAISSALIAKYIVDKNLFIKQSYKKQNLKQKSKIIFEIVKSFSFWQHLSGIIQNWVQTMDLFVLGIFGFPIRTVGLYAAILKLANFSYMIPMTLSNTFLVWIGRRSKEALEQEKKILSRGTVWLIMTNILQFFLFLILAPFIIKIFSHGRWSGEEQSLMFNWIKWILGGAVLFSSCFLFSSWLMVRDNVYKVFIKIYLPWGVASLVVYSSAAYFGGLKWVAIANVPVALIFCVNLLRIRHIESN